jgi:hypothetical protein
VAVIASLAEFGSILNLSIIHRIIHGFQAGGITIVIATGWLFTIMILGALGKAICGPGWQLDGFGFASNGTASRNLTTVVR